ncbi:MAG TPA: permease [Cyanobacteria bacterium UBA8803]|nr:permease [Cyanobacteria bacterium UBA9273]HBL58992.1 permease [Cyanobacteria bacterium UBA8803]
MKLNQWLLLGATSFLAFTLSVSGYATELSNHSPVRSATPTSTANSLGTTVAQSQSVAILSGTFMAAEKPTTGSARIVVEDGHRYLELDEAFKTSEMGPDLHVLLDTSDQPPQMYQNLGSVINLGSLRSYSGAQRYPIPDSINLASFKSVTIWCRMANATFGYAPLRLSSSSSNR